LYANAFTGDVDVVGNDILIGGSDSDVIFGGAGSDRIMGSAGNDFLVGDAGMITRDESLVTLESISTSSDEGSVPEASGFFTGDNDLLDGGLDNDFMIGGLSMSDGSSISGIFKDDIKDDIFVGDLSEDIIIGEYARMRLTIDADQKVTGIESIVTLGQGPLDLIRVAQQELYTAASLTTGSLPTVNADSVLSNSSLAMPTPALAQNTAWAGLDTLVFGDQSSTISSSRVAAALAQTETLISDDQVKYSVNTDASSENINNDACDPELDIEQLCADLKSDSDNTSGLPEAYQAPLSEDVNAQEDDVNVQGEELESEDTDTDISTVAAYVGVSALAGWAAVKGKQRLSAQRLDRSEYALVAAKAKTKRFMSWARFRD